MVSTQRFTPAATVKKQHQTKHRSRPQLLSYTPMLVPQQ